MKAELRIRTMLIPVTPILKSIANLEKRIFTRDERRLMFMVVLEELTYTAWQTVPWNYSFSEPPYQGMAYYKIEKALPGLRGVDIHDIVKNVRAGILKMMEHKHFPNWHYLMESEIGKFQGEPLVFDHGVSYLWWRDQLLVKWFRPTVNYQEMSVNTYAQRVFGPKTEHLINGAKVNANLVYLKMGQFLTTEYDVKI